MLLVVALNYLDIQGADIENAYLKAPCREKVWMSGGIEFGELAEEVLIIEKALYLLMKEIQRDFRFKKDNEDMC